MRYLVGTLEGLLGLLFLVAAVTQFLKGNLGFVPLATILFVVIIGAWFLKKAYDNFRSSKGRSDLTLPR